jgi:hypothetical protein
LTALEWRLFGASLLLLPATSLALRLAGFRRTNRALNALVPARADWAGEAASDYTRAASRMVRLAAVRGLTRPLCLPRSLVLWFLLHRRRIDARLHVGVRQLDGALDAHAWVEWGAHVLNDRRNVRSRYAVFDRLELAEMLTRSRAAAPAAGTLAK